ncbi:hypothetical protein [Enterobacter cloacae complex sp. 363J6]|uniref:hypothetical protein n=1 Tax=Enterobacter cloacae complex sp. 363J6 TaxID=3395868 RepID=UPI003CEFA159
MLIVSRIKSYVRDRDILDVSPMVGETVTVRNYPVNLDHVTWIEDDATIVVEGKRHAAITFHMICSTPITWAGYENKEQRDNAIQAIERRMQFAEITF